MSIRSFAARRGWNDDTLLTLLLEFVEGDDIRFAEAMDCLSEVADLEDDFGDEDEDEEEEDA